MLDLAIFDEMKEDLFTAMKDLKEEAKRHTVLLLFIDIMQEGS